MTPPVAEPIGPGQESVWDYPRPPRLEPVTKQLAVFLGGRCIARTRKGHRVLETSHPPVYFFPLADVDPRCVRPSEYAPSLCEWKGVAKYLDVFVNTGERDLSAPSAAFTYPTPTERFSAIAGHISFYAGSMDRCTVGGERVTPQPGGFYSGWITPDIVGPFKGYAGSERW